MQKIEKKIDSFKKLITEDEKVFLDKNGFLILKDIPNYFNKNAISLDVIAAKLDKLVEVEKSRIYSSSLIQIDGNKGLRGSRP